MKENVTFAKLQNKGKEKTNRPGVNTPRGLFWTSVRSVALEKEQWQTWGL